MQDKINTICKLYGYKLSFVKALTRGRKSELRAKLEAGNKLLAKIKDQVNAGEDVSTALHDIDSDLQETIWFALNSLYGHAYLMKKLGEEREVNMDAKYVREAIAKHKRDIKGIIPGSGLTLFLNTTPYDFGKLAIKWEHVIKEL